MATENALSDGAHRGVAPSVSVILTVVNEERHLAEAIEAVLASDYSGEIEIAIALGPSTDETDAVAARLAAREPRIRLIANPSGRTPDGLNAAIKATSNEIIVRVDGHASIAREYICTAVRVLQETGAVNVGGVMAAEGKTRFQRAVAAAMRSVIGVGPSRFHTGGAPGSTDTVYLGVFRRSAIEAIGGYDPRFTRAQDWELNHRLRQRGGVIWFDPRLQVTYRPRENARKLARQYFEYGRWRHAVARKHKGTANFRYLAPPINLVANLVALLLALVAPIFLLVPACYLLAILIGSILIGRELSERLLLPIVLIIMHFSWGFGFITSPRTLLTD